MNQAEKEREKLYKAREKLLDSIRHAARRTMDEHGVKPDELRHMEIDIDVDVESAEASGHYPAVRVRRSLVEHGEKRFS